MMLPARLIRALCRFTFYAILKLSDLKGTSEMLTENERDKIKLEEQYWLEVKNQLEEAAKKSEESSFWKFLIFVKFVLLIAFSLYQVSGSIVLCANKITYAPDDNKVIANPERGTYSQFDTSLSGGKNSKPLENQELNGKYAEGMSLILRVYYLDKSETNISGNLNLIREDLKCLRSVGMKAILRFAYKKPKADDATPVIALSHISQLQPIFSEFKDVIAVVQAGFIGTWGEWYDGHPDYGKPFDSNFNQNRVALVKKLLEVVPTRFIQLRSYYYKQKIDENNLRLGLHNDCIGAGLDIQHMFEPILDCFDKDKKNPQCKKVSDETKFAPMGGERCYPAKLSDLTLINWDIVVEEFKRNHWSYFLQLYPGDKDEVDNYFISTWGVNLTEMKKYLGYRLLLKDASFEPEIKQGSKLAVTIHIKNVGWASPFNPREARIYLRHKECMNKVQCPKDKELSVKVANLEANKWLPENANDSEIKGEIEVKNLASGEYYAALELYDPYINKTLIEEALKAFPSIPDNNLNNVYARYSIRMANAEGKGFQWEEETGLNQLGTVKVK